MKKDVKKILFCSNKGSQDYKEEVVLLYKDGSSEIVSKEEGTKQVYNLIDLKGVTSLKELIDMGMVEFIHKNNLDSYIKNFSSSVEQNKESSNGSLENSVEKNSIVSDSKMKKAKTKKKRSKLQKIWLGAKISVAALATVVVGMGIKFVHDLFSPSSSKYTKDNDEDNNNESLNVSKNNSETAALLNDYSVNKTKLNFLSKTWNYLRKYNGTYSALHLEKGSGTRLAHTWDEVVAQQLAFNNYSKEQLTKIFDTYEFDADILYDSYLSSVKQEMQAYVVQTNSFGKQDLIKSDKGRDFYSKYESLNIRFNCQSDDTKKVEIAQQFFETIREDFNFEEMSYDDIEAYQLSIVPIVNAMNQKCKNVEEIESLSERELSYFNERMFDKVVLKKFNHYERTVFTYATAASAVNDYEQGKFEQFEDAAMEEIEQLGIYKVKDSKRDISNHKEYQNKINWKYKATQSTNSTTKEETKNNKTVNNKETKNKKKKEEGTKPQEKQENSESDNDSTSEPDYTEEVEEDTPTDDYSDSEEEENTDDQEQEIDNGEDTPTDDNNYENDDSIKDITTDPTGAVEPDEPLPDPNEVNSMSTSQLSLYQRYAEMIVNDMAVNPEFYQENATSYVYTK